MPNTDVLSISSNKTFIKFACNQIWLRFPAKKLNSFHSYSNPIAILKYKQPSYSCFRRKILALYSENSIYDLYELPVFLDNVDFRAIYRRIRSNWKRCLCKILFYFYTFLKNIPVLHIVPLPHTALTYITKQQKWSKQPLSMTKTPIIFKRQIWAAFGVHKWKNDYLPYCHEILKTYPIIWTWSVSSVTHDWIKYWCLIKRLKFWRQFW